MALDFNRLKQAFDKKSNQTENNGFWKKFYPFYKMQENEYAIVRFLPDKDVDNPHGFTVENKYHKLTVNGKTKDIACLKMYGESCPCCELSSKYYDEGNTEMGKKYYRKIDHIFQVVVKQSPFDYEKTDENPVRLLSLSPQIYGRIEMAFKMGDIVSDPTDFNAGHDFRIVKVKRGEYFNYENSQFMGVQTAIDPAVLDKIELYDLKNFRYQKVERDTMELMIKADMTGSEFKESAEGSTEAASALPFDTGTVTTQAETPAAPTAAPAAPAGTSKPALTAQEILAQVRARTNAAKAS